MRTAFINQLIKEARRNDRVFLLVGDLGFSVVEPFAEEFPNRYVNVGICEQNMAGIAGGLALNGYIVYCYSIGNFPTLRCIEQIRNDIAYYNSNVRMVSVGAGYAYGSQGMSHHATEDIGMMRTIPSMVVCSPSDPHETRMITSLSVDYQGPMYIRLGKAGEKHIYPMFEELSIGEIHTYQESNTENALFVTGSIMDVAVRFIKENDIDTAIYSVPFIKPIDRGRLNEIVSRHTNVIVLEEHQKSCGLGSALIEQISDMYTLGMIKDYPKVHRIAINDEFYSISGSQSYLQKHASLILSKGFFL